MNQDFRAGVLLLLVLLSRFGSASNRLSSEDLAGLIPVLRTAMEKYHVPGAVLTVVQRDSILINQGLGYRNVEKRLPVDPDSTIFRLASISKIITATAAMRLVDQGKLSLRESLDPVLRRYSVKNPFPNPLTLFHLLTHTGGFDRYNSDLRSIHPETFASLDTNLKKRLPPIIRPPEEVFVYSNHGFALVGILIETAAGIPFSDFVQREILIPLDMSRSGFDPLRLRSEDFATGYVYDNGWIPQPFEYTEIAPSNMFMSTGRDMAHFMIAHIQNGNFMDRRVLSDSAAAAMHSQQFTNHPMFPGMGFGFMEEDVHGRRVLAHGGYIGGFHAQIMLDPECETGLFLALNEYQGGVEVKNAVLDAFFHLLDPDSTPPQRLPVVHFDLERYTGVYQYTRLISKTTNEKFRSFRGQFRVNTNGQDTLMIGDVPYVPVGHLVFQQAGGNGRMQLAGFREDGSGNIRYLTYGGIDTYLRLEWLDDNRLIHLMMYYCMPVFSFAGAAGILVLFMKGSESRFSKLSRSTLILSAIISALNVLLVIGLNWVRRPDTTGIHWTFHALLLLPLFSLVLSPPWLVFMIRLWLRQKSWGRLLLSAFLLAQMFFIFFVLNWNMLGFPFR